MARAWTRVPSCTETYQRQNQLLESKIQFEHYDKRNKTVKKKNYNKENIKMKYTNIPLGSHLLLTTVIPKTDIILSSFHLSY